MSLQQYYDDFRQGWWADEDANKCLCHGSGWALSDVDTWHQCPIHYRGQPHPEDYVHDECPECGDGRISDPRDCSRCGPTLRKELADAADDRPYTEQEPPVHKPLTDDDIPF